MEDKIIFGLVDDIVKKCSYVEELRALLDDVSDTYPDFVLGMCQLCRREDYCEKMIDYIKSNSRANSVDILGYFFDNVEKVKRMGEGNDEEDEYEEDDDEEWE